TPSARTVAPAPPAKGLPPPSAIPRLHPHPNQYLSYNFTLFTTTPPNLRSGSAHKRIRSRQLANQAHLLTRRFPASVSPWMQTRTLLSLSPRLPRQLRRRLPLSRAPHRVPQPLPITGDHLHRFPPSRRRHVEQFPLHRIRRDHDRIHRLALTAMRRHRIPKIELPVVARQLPP